MELDVKFSAVTREPGPAWSCQYRLESRNGWSEIRVILGVPWDIFRLALSAQNTSSISSR